MDNSYLFAKQIHTLQFDQSLVSSGTTTNYSRYLGDHLSRALFSIESGKLEHVGHERIFHNLTNREAMVANGEKVPNYPKNLVINSSYTGDKSGLFTPIGDFDGANEYVIVGGFADGVVVSNALNDPSVCVLAIQGELHTPKLVKIIKATYPNKSVKVALDGDYSGHKSAVDSECDWICTPISKGVKDWNDLYIAEGLDAVSEVLTKFNDVVPVYTVSQLFSMKKENIEGNSSLGLFNHCLKDVGLVPVLYRTPFELIKDLRQIYKSVRDETVLNIEKFLKNSQEKIKKIALSYNSVSDESKAKHNYFEITSLEDPAIIEMFEQDGVHLLSAPHGKGKTEFVGKKFVRGADDRTLLICPLQSLTADAGNRLGMSNYKDVTKDVKDSAFVLKTDIKEAVKGQGSKYNKVAICLNSIVLTLDTWVDETRFLLVDEISQALNAIATSSYKNFDKEKVYNKLQSIVRNCHAIVGMDSDMNDTVVKFMERCRPYETFNIYELKRPKRRKDIKLNWCYGKVRENIAKKKRTVEIATAEIRILDLIEDGVKFAVATDSKLISHSVASFINTHAPEKRVITINQDTTSTEEGAEFMASPEKSSKDYDVVIYSPSMKSGVSIQNPDYKNVVCIFAGLSIESQDAIQMMCRFRSASEFDLFVAKQQHTFVLDDDDLIERHQMMLSDTSEISDFWRFINNREKSSDLNKSQFAINLYYQLMDYGYDIQHVLADEDRDSEISEIRTEIRKRRISDIANSECINDLRYEAIKRQEFKTEEDLILVEGYKIRRTLGNDKINEELVEMYAEGKGVSAIKLHKSLKGEVHPIDNTENLSPALRRHLKRKAKILKQALDMTSIDLVNMTGGITADEEIRLMNFIADNKEILLFLRLIPAHYAKKNIDDVKDAKKLIKFMFSKALISMKNKKYRDGADIKRSLVIEENALDALEVDFSKAELIKDCDMSRHMTDVPLKVENVELYLEAQRILDGTTGPSIFILSNGEMAVANCSPYRSFEDVI